MSGYFVVPRGWMDHPIFGAPKREPLSRHAAWLWLVERAAFAPRTEKIEGQIAELARGELSVSIRDIGGHWGWPTTKVARFVSELFQHRFIGTRKIGRQLVISICDYEKFSPSRGTKDRTAETKLERSWNDDAPDARAVIKEVEIREISELRSLRAREVSTAFGEWYGCYPHKVGRAAAEKAYRSALARAGPDELMNGLQRYIAGKPPDRAWCNPATWLNQDRWLDQAAENDGRIERKTGAVDGLFGGFAEAAGFGNRGVDSEAARPLLHRINGARSP